MNKEQINIEILFNSVEMELSRQLAFGHVPAVFVNKPATVLGVMVKAWWQIYHECECARRGQDRTVWERTSAYPAQALTGEELLASLKRIAGLIQLEWITAYRPIKPAESAACHILAILIDYYVKVPVTSCKQIV